MPQGKKPVKAQIAGGPRKKLMQVMRASGVPDSAAVNLTNQALGKPKKKQKQSKSFRQKLIAKLREIGAKVRGRPTPRKKPPQTRQRR